DAGLNAERIFPRCPARRQEAITCDLIRAHGLIRANRSGFHPRLAERDRFLLCAGRRLPAVAGRPGPTDQMVLADMLDERFDGSVSIARGILDLGADLAERLAFPCHFAR